MVYDIDASGFMTSFICAPNTAPEPTPVGQRDAAPDHGHCSAMTLPFAVDIASPAWLSFGRQASFASHGYSQDDN